MIQVDRRRIAAPLLAVFEAARSVERWPEWLPHYRWVRFLERRGDGGVVEMAAWRPFGFLRYPTWWVSEMLVEAERPRIRYRHLRGVTRGMDVAWDFAGDGAAVAVTVTHRWDGPAWPLIRTPAANLVIGPLFVHGIAQRTLAGIARHVEGAAR
ncbi:MAG: SRPBCC family protein [Gemmatimonadetes bacterium]|nr:SRPBCC family protein [Gemmatimonadota bacterium]